MFLENAIVSRAYTELVVIGCESVSCLTINTNNTKQIVRYHVEYLLYEQQRIFHVCPCPVQHEQYQQPARRRSVSAKPRLLGCRLNRFRLVFLVSLRNSNFVFLFVHLFLFDFIIITFFFQPNSQEVLPSAIFWTSRGQRCRPFSPSVRTFMVCRAQGSAFPLLVYFRPNMQLTHALELSVYNLFHARRSHYEHALGETT